ncbi:MAG: response regulator transcription factor [Pirellulaceae bacterium]
MKVEPTVFLVDDDPSARKSFRFLAESVDLRVESFESALEFLNTYDVNRPGCLVLDVRMPAMSGLELQQKLIDADIRLPIIFVSAHADIPIASRAFRSGAFDFVQKPVNNNDLLERIQQAVEKDAHWRSLCKIDADVQHRIDSLTPKEREVLDSLVQGKSIKQIASHFNVSIQTAAKHRARILDKLLVDNEVELVYLLKAVTPNEWRVTSDE